ncbi:hypothetical protein FRC05_002192 [Tulasnella sp. 425]|nr:hypothetical protein FRC05_002192 [Tulasnella sp. 425]
MLAIVSGLLVWTSLPKLQHLNSVKEVAPDVAEQYEELPFTGNPHARSCLCPRTPTGQRLCNTYPPAAIKRSQLVSSTNARMKNVLAKFMRERESGSMRRLKVGIMGGSVSACHGVAEDGDSMGKECYGRIIGDWLDERLGGGESGWGKMVEVKNGAIGGMDASYYAFCGMNHLHDDVDIVILEFDVNDQPVSETFFHPDGFHPKAEGQKLLADIVVAHLESVFCEMERDAWDEKNGSSEWTKEETWVGGGPLTINAATTFNSLVSEKNFPALIPGEPSVTVNAYNFLSLPNTTSVQPFPLPHPLDTILDVADPDPESWDDFYAAKNKVPRPFCADANSKVQPFKPKHNTGWRAMVWKNEKHFWVSDTVGAEISVDIKVNEGRVAVFYFRSENLSPGTADCWVDDNEKGAKRLQGYWPHRQNVPSVTYIDAEVTPGNHFVTCRISPDSHDPSSPIAHHFRIVAVMST